MENHYHFMDTSMEIDILFVIGSMMAITLEIYAIAPLIWGDSHQRWTAHGGEAKFATLTGYIKESASKASRASETWPIMADHGRCTSPPARTVKMSPECRNPTSSEMVGLRHSPHRLAVLVPRKKIISFRNSPNNQWIGLREILQESPIFNGKIYGFL